MLNLEDNQTFYYKIVAKLSGKYYSIYDGKTEFSLGETLFQKAEANHQGGFYVYSSPKEALYAHIPFNKGGLYIAPRTLLKVMCWGEKLVYDSGKIAFSYICPVEDIGLPKGYKTTRAGKSEALKLYKNLEVTKRDKMKKKEQSDKYNF